MNISLKNYTLRYLTLAFLIILALWTLLLGAYIYEEFYIDDHRLWEEVLDDDLLLNLAFALAALYIVLVVSMYVINLLLIQKLWKPFNLLLKQIQDYQVGSAHTLSPLRTQVIEFNVLQSNIQQMWQRNEALFHQQKEFTENASHELQTPLAITLNKVELLLEDSSFSEEQLIQLSQIKQSLMRMTQLNKSLLMISRIENQQFKQTEKVSFKEVLNSILPDLQDLLEYKQLLLTVVQNSDFQVAMNRYLAEILLSNLLRNAIKYTPKQGSISIEMSHTHLSILNTPSAATPLNAQQIFRRFHKGTQDNTSTGLGLAIAQSIAQTSKLNLQYHFKQEKHCFTISK